MKSIPDHFPQSGSLYQAIVSPVTFHYKEGHIQEQQRYFSALGTIATFYAMMELVGITCPIRFWIK